MSWADDILKDKRKEFQMRVVRGYLKRKPDAGPEEVYRHLRCIAGIGKKSLQATKEIMEELKNELEKD